MSVLAKFKEYKGTQIKPTYQKGTEKPKEDTKKDYEPAIAKVEKQEFKPFTPALPFVPTMPTQQRLGFNQPKSIESDLPKTTKVSEPITGKTLGLENVKTYQAPIGQSKKELDAKDKAEKIKAKETAETLEKELTKKYGFKVKRANSPIEYANILLKVPANQKEEFKKDYDAYTLAVERSDPFRAGAEAGFNILPTNLEKTQGKEVVEEAKDFGAGRFVGGAGQQAAFASVLGAPIEGLVGKVLPKATPFITETIKDVAIGTGTQLAEAPFDKPTAEQFVGNVAMDIALNALFGAVGKGLSKIDLTSLKTAKPQSVVEEVAKQMDINEQQANDLINRSIDVYVNQYGVADTKPFEQLQLPSPKGTEYKTDTTAINIRQPKKPDVYVNQFGVADTKPFEQLQLDAPRNIASDTSAVRFRDGVQPQYKGADFKGEMSLTERKYPTANLGDRKIKAFQFNNPEVQPFYREKAEELLLDATYAKRGSRKGTLARDEFGEVVNRYGDPRVTTPQMARILDETGSKYEDIQKALQDLIDDNGKENHALAKKIENVIDDMLVEGYVNVVGETIKPNIRYIQLRNRLDTTKIPIPELEGPKASQLNNQLRMGGLDESGQRNVFDADMQRTDFDDFLDASMPTLKTEQPKIEKPKLELPQDFSVRKPQYPPLAKDFARETVTPKITPQLKPKANLQDITIQKPTYPQMQPEFTKERPSVLQPGDVKPTLKADEVTDPVLKKFRLDLFGATPEKPIKAVVEGKLVNVVGVKNNVATLSDGTNVAVKNVAMPKTKIEPTLKPKQVDFEKETLSAKTETVANGEIKERGFSKNIRTDKNRVDELRQEFDQNKEFYETLSNKSTLESAQARFDRGYEAAIKDFRATSDTIRADNVPLAKLIADEATKRGDMEVAREVVVKAAESLTKAGQFSQAAKILRESNDPITIMQFVNKEIKKLNNQGSTRYGNKWDNIKLDENELDLIAKISKDATDEEKEEVFKQIFDSISKRIPTTKREQFDAWRRIAMLFNPKTHVRNTLGNTLMKGLKLISDKTAQAMELTLPKDIRTKGFATKELKETAKTYFDSNKKTLLEGSRWDIFGVASPFSEKQIFKNQFLESLNEISKKTLEGEDIFFFKSNFINDLAGFMNARGLKEPTEEAVQYALRRSQEATFRQANEVANAINKLKGSRIGLLVDAAIPFTKTPANILKTGIDYSPIGAMKSVVEILNKADPATAIENLSKGLTGTGLALIGAWASVNGLARGDYEKKANVEGLYQATGMLPNSIKTPGGSYTIDWAQPIAMPFFMGVAFMDELKKGGQSKADAAFKALLQSGESLVNQSMLSGVKDLFGGYGTMTEKIIQLPINYMTQGFPTVGGQIARVIDPYKRQIDYSNIIDSTITSLQAKTPLLTKELPVKRDILGKPQEYGKGLLNVFQQFLSPGFIGKETDDPVIKEISRLYESVGSDVLPKAKVTDFSNEKIKYNLTTQEISEVQRIMGEYTNKQLLSLMNSYDYKNATDVERAKMVKKANETGYELAKKTIVEARKK